MSVRRSIESTAPRIRSVSVSCKGFDTAEDVADAADAAWGSGLSGDAEAAVAGVDSGRDCPGSGGRCPNPGLALRAGCSKGVYPGT